MTTINFTDAYIKNVKPQTKQFEIFDGSTANLSLRVSPGGTKTFTFFYRMGRRKRRLSLGQYPNLSLKQARGMADNYKRCVAAGEDPQADKLRDREQYQDSLFSSMVDEYIETHGKRKTRSWPETQRLLKRDFVSKWGKISLKSIDKRMVRRRLDEIYRNGGPSAANHAFAAIRGFFNWCIREDFLSQSPCKGMEPPATTTSRERVLSDQELRVIWTACDEMGYPFGPYMKLLVLTGQRRTEVSGLRWDRLDLEERIWIQDVNKSNRTHIVPLSDQAIAIIDQIPRLHNDLVFPARGKDNPISGFSMWKEKLDDVSGASDWTLHDLRRTISSKLAEFGIALQVSELALNHSSRKLSGIARIYNRYDYAKEKRDALDLWAKHLADLVN